MNAQLTNSLGNSYNETVAINVIKVKHFTLTYKDNDNIISTETNIENETNHVKSIETLGYKKEGYTFTGWNTHLDGTGENYPIGADITSDTILYAQWVLNTPNTPSTPSSDTTNIPSSIPSSDKTYTPTSQTPPDTKQSVSQDNLPATGEKNNKGIYILGLISTVTIGFYLYFRWFKNI